MTKCPFENTDAKLTWDKCPVNFISLLNGLEAKCPSCDIVLARDRLVGHFVNQCPGAKVKCNGCDFELPREVFHDHFDWCSEVLIPCRLCHKDYRRGKIPDHIDKDCPAAEVKCVCSGVVPRSSLEKHKKEECPHTVVSCSAAMVGCTWSGVIPLRSKHEKKCKALPFLANFEALLTKIKTLEIDNKELQSRAQFPRKLYENLIEPCGVTFVSGTVTGTFYVANTDHHSITMFDRTGQWLGDLKTSGELSNPWTIIFHNNLLYVSNCGFDQVNVLTLDGTCIRTFTGLNKPTGLCIAGGRLYISDSMNHRVQVYTLGGILTRSLTTISFTPEGITVDDKGLVYAADRQNNRIVVFSATDNSATSFGSLGWSPGQFKSPRGLAWANGLLYVADTGNDRIQIFSERKFVGQRTANGLQNFVRPYGVTVHADGTIFVADTKNDTIQILPPFTKLPEVCSSNCDHCSQ
jgi:sugar lactone lactonase YvrE